MKDNTYKSKGPEIDAMFEKIFHDDAVDDENDVETDVNSENSTENTETDADDSSNDEADADTAAETKPDTDASENDSLDNDADDSNASADGDSKGAEGDTAKSEKGNGTYETAMKVAADISEINNAFGLKIKTISDIENPKRFFELRDIGLSATEAFRATNSINTGKPDGKNDVAAGKQHMTSSVASASGNSKGLSERELRNLRECFPDKSDKEIEALYHSVKKKGLI